VVNAKGETLVVVRLELPIEVRDAFRVVAAQEKMSMAALARKLVEAYVQRKSKPKGGQE
jgi:hypothetical protein